MRKWLLLFTLMAVCLFPVGVQAQSNIRFSSIVVDIQPDLDKPSVLVIYHYILASDVSLPASLELRIPIQAKDSINAVAVADSSGTLVLESYTTTVSGDWTVISMQSTSRNITVEYYDAYIKKGDTRSYTYTWSGNYPVDAFSVSFIQPLDATDLKLVPDLGAATVDANGLAYYNSAVGALAVNQGFTLSIEYKKTTDRLSASLQAVQPTGPVTSSFIGKLANNMPLILGILGGLLVVAALIVGLIYWRRDQKRSNKNLRKRHTAGSQNGNLPGDAYCNQCGKRAQPGDVFCRTCGSRLRRE
jgi:hypothetical protein